MACRKEENQKNGVWKEKRELARDHYTALVLVPFLSFLPPTIVGDEVLEQVNEMNGGSTYSKNMFKVCLFIAVGQTLILINE